MSALTIQERETLNAAMDIILANTPPNASWSFSANHWHGSRDCGPTCYFSAEREQHSFLAGPTFADMIADGLAKQEFEDGNRDTLRALRIERLKGELAELTGEAP